MQTKNNIVTMRGCKREPRPIRYMHSRTQKLSV